MPFYQFNQFTGRLKNSTNLQPLYPIAPNPLQSGEPPKMIWDSIKTVPVKVDKAPVGTAGYSTLPPKLIAKMKHFQQPGWRTTPVFLMGGTPDKILLGVSLALMVVGLAGCVDFVWRNANKK